MSLFSFVVFAVLASFFLSLPLQAQLPIQPKALNPSLKELKVQVDRLVQQQIEKLKLQAQVDQKNLPFFVFPAYLGSHYISQYYLVRSMLGGSVPMSHLDERKLLKLILDTQAANGSWLPLADENFKHGADVIEPSIYNYWVLKILLHKIPDKKMEIRKSMIAALKFVRSNGGAEKSNLFAKVIMALSGNINWSVIPYVPLDSFEEPLYSQTMARFSQWVIPHLKPISYLRSFQVQFPISATASIQELFLEFENFNEPQIDMISGLGLMVVPATRSGAESLVVGRLLNEQHLRGSWGAYTVSTMLSILTLQDYKDRFIKRSSSDNQMQIKIDQQITKGLRFVEDLYFDSKSPSAYMGALDDSSYWDTILVARAFAENDIPVAEYEPYLKFLESKQVPNGGIPFGYDFESYPDVDDTAEYVLAARKSLVAKSSVKAATDFIINFQNSDGGWGTFDKENVGGVVLKGLTKKFEDSADLFDESEADMTGHALEVMGHAGIGVQDQQVKKALRFLRKTQDPRTFSWRSRWAVNHIFGVSAVISGVAALGSGIDGQVLVQEEWIQKSLNWLESIQNTDGGFGESTRSYNEKEFIGRGVSTPSQTAWAIMAFVDGGRANSPVVQRAIRYLIREIAIRGEWIDQAVTGTGHPGLIYMHYPSYAKTWPLIALGKWRSAAN